MWDIKLKALISKQDKQKLIDKDNSLVVARRKKWLGGVVKSKGPKIHGNRRRLDFAY